MGQATPFYIEQLHNELNARQGKNSRYSIRAFSSLLEMDSSQLTKVMKRKSLLSLEKAQQISNKLSFPQDVEAKFVRSAAEEQVCLSLNKVNPTLTDCHLKEE